LATPLGAYSVQDKLVPEEGGWHQHLWALWSITRMLWSSRLPPPSRSIVIDPPWLARKLRAGDHTTLGLSQTTQRPLKIILEDGLAMFLAHCKQRNNVIFHHLPPVYLGCSQLAKRLCLWSYRLR
jgi:hypothetical protein